MTKISRLPINPDKMLECINMLWSVMALMGSKDDVRLLFKDLFSHTELKMFAKRLAVARKLLAGCGYDEIIKELKVTDRTIAHINNILAEKGDGLRNAHTLLSHIEDVRIKKQTERIRNLSRPFKGTLPGSDVLPKMIGHGFVTALDKIDEIQKRRSAKKDLPM